MAKAKKLPSGMWRCRVMVDGKSESFTAFTAADAELMAAEWKAHRQEKRDRRNLTVAEMMEEYINGREGVLSPSTIAGYKKVKRLYFGEIMDVRICKLTESMVQQEISTMSRSGLSPKTIRNAWGFLRSACKLNDFDIRLPQKEKPTYRTPGIDDIRKILHATTGTPIEIPVLLALWCGLRLSEIRGLEIAKVSENKIIIDQAIVDVDGVPTVKKPKTYDSVRTIDIPKFIYDKVQELPKEQKYVTTLSGHAIYKRFQNLTGKICRFHDLRHANASVMMMLGVPDAYAMERGGWQTEKIYKKTYTQTYDEGRAAASNRIDTFFSSLLNDCHESCHKEEKNLLQ